MKLLACCVVTLLMGCTFERYRFTGDPYTNRQKWLARKLAADEAEFRAEVSRYIRQQQRARELQWR